MATLEEQVAQRQSNLDELTKLGVDVYPRRFARTHSIAQLVAGYSERTREEFDANRIQTTTSADPDSDRSGRQVSCCRTA
jgi:lysyl-tRNA synthetase class II